MSIQRIDNEAKHMHGWQVRQYTFWPRYLSRYFADKAHGGRRKAYALAKEIDLELAAEARRMRRRRK